MSRNNKRSPKIKTDLSTTGYEFLDPSLISAFVERWHEETLSFHLPSGEITVTLRDASCLLHLPIEGRLLDHQGIMTRDDGVVMMVTLLGAEPHFAESQSVADYTEEGNVEEGNVEEADKFKDFAIRMVADYLWGSVALTHLYKGLFDNTATLGKVIIGYMTLLQAWIIYHLRGLGGRVENDG
ncbi:serine/threonine-protein phosphatase 7 long form-like protein, partial [Trifolium medium]|nr:serine/threonine-protein phosphatase 7 long form-like protein [Trifolium medium]